MTLSSTLLAATLVIGAASSSAAAELVPFEAEYELKIVEVSEDLVGGEARIASRLERETCDRYDLEFRFVAKLVRSDRTVVTDQQTTTVEDRAAGTYAFTTKTFVDGSPESLIQGTATSASGGTTVHLEQPEPKTFELPVTVFPSAHTADLVDRAMRGESTVETRLYDGDNEADKNLTTTALILPGRKEDASSSAAAGALRNLKNWRINESYFNDDMRGSGLPLFRMSYVLYENGVTDELVMDTGDYAFAGSLSKLVLSPPPSCANGAR